MNIFKYLPILFLFFTVTSGCAQIKILSLEKLTLPDSGKYYHPKFHDSGELLLLTSENYTGLELYDMSTKSLIHITGGEAAGYAPVFSEDGQTVVYTEHKYFQNRKYSEIHAFDRQKETTRILEPAVHSLTVPMIAGNQVIYKADGELKNASVKPGEQEKSDWQAVGIEDQKLVLYTGQTRKELTPFPGESYIWPSFSPDGNRILAYATGKGAFICDKEGVLLEQLGNIEAPEWAGNEWVAGMITRDDGHQILESHIILYDLKSGKLKKISPDKLIAMYPSVSSGTGKIAFQTAGGDIYIVQYETNR